MTLWIVVSCCESLPPAIVFRCFISFCVSQRPSVHCPLSHLFSMECELPFSFDDGIAEYDRYCDAAAHIQMEEPSTPETHAVSALADLGQTSSTETSPFSETTSASPVSQSMAHANDSSSPPVRVRKRMRGKTTSAAYDPFHKTEIKQQRS